MKHCLLTLLLSTVAATVASRCWSPESAYLVEPAVPEAIEERVVNLPEDGHQWHTILFLRPEWKSLPDERKAESLFHSEPWLVSLKSQTHWHLITTDQTEFAKFRPLVNATPCLVIERANGEVVYRESGPDLAHRSGGLMRSIRKEIERHCPDGRCLPLHPVPGPHDPPVDDAVPTLLREEQPAPANRKGTLWLVLTALAGGMGGVAWQWKRTG